MPAPHCTCDVECVFRMKQWHCHVILCPLHKHAEDLYESLEEFDEFAWTAVQADCPEAAANLNRKLARARAALAKARGEQPPAPVYDYDCDVCHQPASKHGPTLDHPVGWEAALAKAQGEQPPAPGEEEIYCTVCGFKDEAWRHRNCFAAPQSGSAKTAQEAVEQLEHVSVNRDEKPARYSDCTACGHLSHSYDFRAAKCRKCGRFVYLPTGSTFTPDRRPTDAQR